LGAVVGTAVSVTAGAAVVGWGAMVGAGVVACAQADRTNAATNNKLITGINFFILFSPFEK
jgi:hypothetical protein